MKRSYVFCIVLVLLSVVATSAHASFTSYVARDNTSHPSFSNGENIISVSGAKTTSGLPYDNDILAFRFNGGVPMLDVVNTPVVANPGLLISVTSSGDPADANVNNHDLVGYGTSPTVTSCSMMNAGFKITFSIQDLENMGSEPNNTPWVGYCDSSPSCNPAGGSFGTVGNTYSFTMMSGGSHQVNLVGLIYQSGAMPKIIATGEERNCVANFTPGFSPSCSITCQSI